jgi:hypothetical protein
MIPKPARAAQMIDERAGAKDHFLTLATIDPAQCPESLHARLRRETDQFADRVELKHDFPYQPKRSAFWSVSVSLIVALLVYFLLPVVVPMLNPPSVQQQLREVAEKIAQAPRLKELSQQSKHWRPNSTILNFNRMKSGGGSRIREKSPSSRSKNKRKTIKTCWRKSR